MALSIQIAIFTCKSHQYQLRADSPNLIVTKITHYLKVTSFCRY